VACYNDLFDISMLTAEEGWAVGYNGVVLHYTTPPDGGEPTWQQVHRVSSLDVFYAISAISPDEWWGVNGGILIHYKDGTVEPFVFPGGVVQLFDLAVVQPDDVWAVGTQGGLVHYYQGKIERVDNLAEVGLSAIAMLNAQEGWAVGEGDNALLHYHNGIWEPVTPPATPPVLSDLAIVGEDEVWAVGSRLVHYGAGQWEEINLEGGFLEAISMVSAEEGWAVGAKGLIMRYQAGVWQSMASPTQKDLYSIDMVNAEEGWAVGKDSTLLHYHEGVWELVSQSEKPPSILSDIDWVDDEGWAVGGNGTILHYQDGEWRPVESPIVDGRKLNAVDMINVNEGWAVGWNGMILHYTQNVWQLVSSPVTQDLNDLDIVNNEEGWAVGSAGTMIHYINNEWRQIESPTDQVLVTVDMVSEQEGWAAGHAGTVLHYQGSTWRQIEPSIDTVFFKIDMLNEAEGWMLGVKEGGGVERTILYYDNNKWQPFEHPQGYAISAIDMLSTNEGWFISQEGILHYRAGEWQIFDNPARVGASIVMVNESEGWAVGDGILHYTNE
jgi:photosystem II stability/assembly factor-like uncharacterized protein